MAAITEDYVSFETAKLLKEKGFIENCLMRYNKVGDLVEEVYKSNWNFQTIDYYAPTLQMAMKWLRKVYNIHIEIFVVKNYDKKICKYTYTIMYVNFPGSDDGIDCCNEYKTYEQACEESIKYCLEHLVW